MNAYWASNKYSRSVISRESLPWQDSKTATSGSGVLRVDPETILKLFWDNTVIRNFQRLEDISPPLNMPK